MCYCFSLIYLFVCFQYLSDPEFSCSYPWEIPSRDFRGSQKPIIPSNMFLMDNLDSTKLFQFYCIMCAINYLIWMLFEQNQLWVEVMVHICWLHNEVLIWMCFPDCWPFLAVIHWSPVDFTNKVPIMSICHISFAASLKRLNYLTNRRVASDFKQLSLSRHNCN